MGINLYMETSVGIISVPFVSIKEVDLFTVEYGSRFDNVSNERKLLDVLIRILQLPISVDDIGRVYLSYKDIDDIGFNYETCLPIKYSRDNYNVDSVIENFSLYFKRNQSRLNYPGISNVANNLISRFIPGEVSNNDIDLVVRAYLKDDYRRIRDVYFYLSELDSPYEKYNIRIDRYARRDNSYDRQFSDIESNNDDFIQYLIELSSRGDMEYNIAMEELSKCNLEDVRRSIGGSSVGVIDGLSDSRLNDKNRDIANLEECTGISIDKLRKLCKKQISDGRER